MDIILIKDYDELGREGDVISVTRGHARNFIIPKSIGIGATPQNLKAFELKKKKIEVKRLKAKEDAEAIKEKIEALLLTFSHKAGEEGKLYGSVTSMDISTELESKGVIVDRKKIALEGPIKNLGDFDVPVKIYPEVTASLKISVIPEVGSAE